jgi:CxxC-x17-CxxC domain-containing protein
MANQPNEGGFQRKMFKGDWKCSECGATITELPFEPDPNRMDQLLCRDCHQKKQES